MAISTYGTLKTAVAVAWAAGLFEGEGSISPKYNRLCVTSTDLDVLKKFQAIVGCGKIYPRKPCSGQLGKKPQWNWVVSKIGDSKIVAALFMEHLGSRRKAKMQELLSWFEREKTVNSGEKNGNARLKLVDVLDIKREEQPAPLLAKKYGVTLQNIRSIQKGETWKVANGT